MATSELFFSEYVEGSSFNKAVEIFNGTGAAIDLTGYTLQLYSNGAATPSQSLSLGGTIASNDVLVLAHGGADGAILAAADVTNNAVINFNGDDALVLRRNGVIIDVIGQIGVDPGAEWGSGLTSTADSTLRRLPGVTAGDTDGGDPFDPAAEWEGFALNTFDGLGAHSVDDEGDGAPGLVIVASGGGAEVTEGGAADSFTVALATAPTADVTVAFTPDDETRVSPATLVFTSANWNQAQTVAVAAVDDAVDEDPDQHGSTIAVAVTSADAGYDGLDVAPVAVRVTDDEAGAPTLIGEIQGEGAASTYDGQVVTIQAVVVGDFQDDDGDPSRNLGGFFLQEEDADADGDAATSEGVFVFGGGLDVDEGDLVTVTGTVDEYFGLTQLASVSSITVESSGNALPSAARIDLSSLGGATVRDQNGDFVPDLEAYEGMLVEFTDTLTITEMFNLDRFNEIRLVEGERPQQYTQFAEPDAEGYQAYLQQTGARSIVYDDGQNRQNVDIGNLDGFAPFTTATAPSMGDTITGLRGVLDYQWAGAGASGATWRVRATENGQNAFEDTNPADLAPPDVGGDLTVASMNVLNFFTTLDNGSNLTSVGLEPRGANSQAEYERQLDKLVAAIGAVDADVLGLVEIENDVSSAPLATLVGALNAEFGAGTYAYVNTGRIGTDAIATAFLYQPGTVALTGDFAVLDDASFVDPLGAETTGASYNRPALAQTFTEIETGEAFTAVANHLKSKGSGTGAAADEDQGDGQGASNATRTAAAEALADWIATDPTGTGDADYLLLGDYNAYAREDPVEVLEARGYTDLARSFGGEDVHSYVFDGYTGTLDYAFANDPLLAQVTDAAAWHSNSDEADGLDYNLDFGRDPSIFDGDSPLRASDHDLLLVGLDLDSARPPETVMVAVEIEPRPGAVARAVETVDGAVARTSTLPPVSNDRTFSAADIRVEAAAPGNERLTFVNDAMGLRSGAERPNSAEAGLLDGDEEFRFQLTGGDFGDAVGAEFAFGAVRGGGAVTFDVYRDGALIDTVEADARAGSAAIDLSGASFDEVRMIAEGGGALAVTGFAFARLAVDDLLLA